MKHANNIFNELAEISPLVADIGKLNVFVVAQDYFETLDSNILSAVQNQFLNNLINNYSKQNTAWKVPQGYFESLSNTILNKIKLQQSTIANQELPTILQNNKNINVFTIPQNYFELLPAKILAKIQPTKAKIFTFQNRTATIFKYAVAAVFTSVIALGVYKYVDKTATKNFNNLPSYVAAGMKIKNIDAELANVKDDDIINYLKDNGENIDVALVSNSLNTSDLPLPADYLNDDNALDKYIENTDYKN